MASGKNSSSTKILSNDSKDVVSSKGKVVEVREVSPSQVAESAASSNFTTRDSR